MATRQTNRTAATRAKRGVAELRISETSELNNGRPAEAEIRRRAYEIYLSRNGAPGNAVVDWLQAEIELRGRKGKAPSN